MQSLSTLYSRFKGAVGLPTTEVKTSAAARLKTQTETAWVGLGNPQWTTRSYEKLTTEGYRKNVVANRSVKILAESAASIPLTLYRGDEQLRSHPLLDLLARPNPMQSGAELLESLYSFLQIAGNSYLEGVTTTLGQVGELYVLRPDRMTVVPGPKGLPLRYDYKVGGNSHSFAVDQVNGKSPIMHMKVFHPQDDWYGLSPLEAAAYGIDIHNAAACWNKALFDNAARPSGALVFEPAEGEPGTLSDEQFTRLKGELEDQYQGTKNAGRPFLLEGGLKWQQIAFSPVDMEFISAKHVSAREIALAFGVPPMILGIPGDNTYANYAEANRALWRLTLLPLMEKTVAALNAWLVPQFGDDLRLTFDRDAITALTFERDALWTRLQTASFLTPNEKRAQLGFAPVDGGDELPPSGMLPPSGGENGFFNQGSGVTQASDPALKTAPMLECGCSGVDEVKNFAATKARYLRLLKVQQEYEKEAQNNPNVTFLRHWVHVPGVKSGRSYHKNVKAVGMNEPFIVGNDTLELPCDPSGMPGNVINCRCRVEYQRLEKDTKSGIWKPTAIKYGNKAILTDDEIANIVFNETASLSGNQLEEARKAFANTIINADEKYGVDRIKFRKTGPSKINRTLDQTEQLDLANIKKIVVPSVRGERLVGIDRANGNLPFGIRDVNNFSGGFSMMMKMVRKFDGAIPVESYGPFNNSHPSKAQNLGPTGNYLVIFR